MKYDAFISYRHLEKDMFVAKGIHKALETTKIPLRIRKEIGKKGIQRVFRDQEELPIGASLSDNIESALAESEFLVVICSPQTKESAWVMKEIDTFIEMHGRENILAVLIDGEPEDSFPPQLLVDDNGNPREPLAADVRGSSRHEMKKKIKSESLRLAASILYCDYDTLKQRHRERVMRRYTAIAAGVAVLGVLFGIYNAYNLARINENYRQKLTNESRVMAATSRQVLETGDTKTAALIALEALPSEDNDRPFVSDAMYALSSALGTYSIGDELQHDKTLTHDVNASAFATGFDSTRILSYDKNDCLYYWNVETGDLIFKKNTVYYEGKSERILDVTVNDTARAVATNHFFTGYDEEGNVIYDKHFDDDYIVFAKFSKDGNYAGFCFRTFAAVYDARTGEEVKRFDDEDVLYSSGMIFSEDDKLFGIDVDLVDTTSTSEYATVDTGEGHFRLYDVATGKGVEFTVNEDVIQSIYFTPDDNIVFASADRDTLITTGTFTDYVQKFDRKTGENLWTCEIERTRRGADYSECVVKSRVIETTAGKKGEVLVSAGRNLYNIDLYTGELTNVVPVENDIVGYYISTVNEVVQIGLASGSLIIVDASTGYKYADNTVEVGESLVSYKSSDGYIFGVKQLHPDIVVMSYVEDKTGKSVVESESLIYYTAKSPGGTNYFYTTKSSMSNSATDIFVMDAETDQQLSHFSLEGAVSLSLVYYDDDTIICPTGSNGLYFCDVNTGEAELLEGSDEKISYWAISGDRKIAVANNSRDYRRFDLENRKILDEGEYTEWIGQGGYYDDGFLSEDGSKTYYWDYSGGLYTYDYNTKEFEQLFERYVILSAVCSKDGSKIALQCGDGYVRVADLSSMEILHEVRYFGGASNYIGFSDDCKKLYLQGADYYFKIYDLEKDEYVFISDDQWNDANYTMELPDDNLLVVGNGIDLYFFDLENYGLMTRVQYGMVYFEDTGEIISMHNLNLYRFQFKSVDDLITEAREKYGDAKLTKEQRLKYRLN